MLVGLVFVRFLQFGFTGSGSFRCEQCKAEIPKPSCNIHGDFGLTGFGFIS